MIQILGLRDYTDRNGKTRKAEKFFDKHWRAESVPWLFANIDKVLSEIPKEEHYNLYYTASICEEVRETGKKGRVFVEQDILPIDIDGIDTSNYEAYVKLVCDDLKIKREQTGIVMSGNGLQFIIAMKKTWDNVTVFDEKRSQYKAMAGRLNNAMYMAGLDGSVDTSIFSAARLLRLPNTKNIKPKGERVAFMVNANIEAIDFEIHNYMSVPFLEEGEYIHPRAVSKMPLPDTKEILKTCLFLENCKQNQATLSEPLWYASLSILARLDNGIQLCHDYSKGHPDYNSDEVELKASQSIEASGPRTCDNINSLWDGCKKCTAYMKCKSPIMLRGKEFIATKETGFYEMGVDKNGNAKRGKPNYDDLAKHFDDTNPYTTMDLASIVHTYDGKKWADYSRNYIHGFAEKNFDPKPNNSMCMEFESKLKRTNIKPSEFFLVEGFINFQNGVLEIETMNFLPHSKDFGFKYVLPYDYEPEATCPVFDKFMKDITCNREKIEEVLIQYLGYTMCGVNPFYGEKALVMYGDGSNGKSVLIEVFKALAGEGNYSTLSMGNEINRLENRYQLSGKLFNVSEETPTNSMVENTVFKSITVGGEVQARKLYCDSFSMRNYAKIIMACNELPKLVEFTNAMDRRLLIVPFEATFTNETKDIFIVDKLKKELSGIFNRALIGYQHFMNIKKFIVVKEVADTLTQYVEDNDSVIAYINDECVKDAKAECAFKELYLNYKFYCEQFGYKPLAGNQFSKRIKGITFTLYKKDCTCRVGTGVARVRGFKGIGLTKVQQGAF